MVLFGYNIDSDFATSIVVAFWVGGIWIVRVDPSLRNMILWAFICLFRMAVNPGLSVVPEGLAFAERLCWISLAGTGWCARATDKRRRWWLRNRKHTSTYVGRVTLVAGYCCCIVFVCGVGCVEASVQAIVMFTWVVGLPCLFRSILYTRLWPSGWCCVFWRNGQSCGMLYCAWYVIQVYFITV